MNVEHEDTRGMCDGCHYLLQCHVYYVCEQCGSRLCVDCFRSSGTDRRPVRWKDATRIPIRHYSHVHDLTRCRFKENIDSCRCVICETTMWGDGYACLKCNHYVHESCMDTPQTIYNHPFHPIHRIHRLTSSISYPYGADCERCCGKIASNEEPFSCEECKFYLHARCVIARAVNLGRHEHGLVYGTLPDTGTGSLLCDYCHRVVECNKPRLRCVQCPKDFHVKCAVVPKKVEHFAHHHHSLTLVETASYLYKPSEQYCDICESTMDVKAPSYCCGDCRFFAHVECVLSKGQWLPQFVLSDEPKETNHIPRDSSSNNEQILHPWHPHPLSLKNGINETCRMCWFAIDGRAYKCETCILSKFWVHGSCARLPEHFDHPLHPNHTLSLSMFSGYRMCYLCRDFLGSLGFICRTCDFAIDIKCMDLKENGFDNMGNALALKHDFHEHELTLVKGSSIVFGCKVCEETFNYKGSLAYFCRVKGCFIAFHLPCLRWSGVVESHPLHPSHRLELAPSAQRLQCFACDELISWDWGYKCETYGTDARKGCRVFFHLQCGISLGRLLKYRRHDHLLYYFHRKPTPEFEKSCIVCIRRVESAYYRCRECGFHVHLRCLGLSPTAKHKLHIHPFSFEDSSDDGGYYCDICEEPRDPKHPVYSCKDCNFVSHVECTASEENV
ncbi:PREDICTED: uncharacterized protein LOC104812211 [Tarenaya hassleriana]|uniref:uncharacterized protein LOC104812211 n=1 Tax=Tarenaya hassleriana TaxID=28532 RepID=UPI00053CA40B|nr:PREDICTED: uncharacterized protein LOC104812211 [Tarenaya hassleriana]